MQILGAVKLGLATSDPQRRQKLSYATSSVWSDVPQSTGNLTAVTFCTMASQLAEVGERVQFPSTPVGGGPPVRRIGAQNRCQPESGPGGKESVILGRFTAWKLAELPPGPTREKLGQKDGWVDTPSFSRLTSKQNSPQEQFPAASFWLQSPR